MIISFITEEGGSNDERVLWKKIKICEKAFLLKSTIFSNLSFFYKLIDLKSTNQSQVYRW